WGGGKGILTLISRDGRQVAKGKQVTPCLYELSLKRQQSTAEIERNFSGPDVDSSHLAVARSWADWHRLAGPLGCSGMEAMHRENLVDGFKIDESSQKHPDCRACTEAKQAVLPFPDEAEHRSKKLGELTFIDLWGPAQTVSIDGEQHFIVFVDDTSRYIKAKGLKKKDEAEQRIKDHLTYLKTHGMTPKAIRVDPGGEFMSNSLKAWLSEQGINIQKTAPHFYSQNGVAEHMM